MINERINKIKNYLNSNNIDCMIVYKNIDLYYLTNFYDEEDNSALLITKDNNYFITDGRFINAFKNTVKDFELKVIDNKITKFSVINKIMEEDNLNKVILNFNYASYKDVLDLKNKELIDSDNLISNFRRQKDKNEIALIKKACEIAENSFLNILDKIKVGITEKDIKFMIENEFIKNGADCKSFPTIIASGNINGALPHAIPTDRKIENGDLITIDFGCRYKNYCSDITRTVGIGNVSDKQREIYKIVKETKEMCESKLKKSVATIDLNQIAINNINKYNYEFLHGLGHGIGLQIHELPVLGKSSKEILEVNDVHTIEPGIYVPGVCGVRIEDDYLITEDGYECLTPNISTDLIIL